MKLVKFAFAAALAATAGCINSVNTTENADKNMTPTHIADARFVTDGFLRDRLALRNVRFSPAPGGLQQVQVEATSLRVGFWDQSFGPEKYHVRYKFTWFDQNGMAIETVLSDWQDMWILPGETVQFQSVAPSPACKDFRLNLMEGK